MKAPWHSSLLAKTLGWLTLHLVLLVAGFVLFVNLQLRVGLDSLLSGRTGERLRDLGETISHELRSSPRAEWNSILQSHSSALGLQVDLWRPLEEWQAGVFTHVPPNVMARLKEVRLPPGRQLDPGPGRRLPFGPEAGPGPGPGPRPGPGPGPGPGGFAPQMQEQEGVFRYGEPGLPGVENNRPQDRMPPSAKPAFFLRGDSGEGYWAAIDVPLAMPRNQNPQHAIVLIRSDDLSGNGLFFEVRPWILGAIAVIALSLAFWAPFVLGITRYIRRLTDATERIADGDFKVKIASGRQDELGRLGSAVSDMAGRLDHFVTGQRRFLADVAHELCAPLARLRTGIAVLEPSVPEDRQPRLAAVEEDANELAKLIEEVLAFSKAGAGKPQLQACGLNSLINAVVVKEAGEMVVDVKVASDLTALADPRMLARAFGNLVRNARVHAGPAARLEISAFRRDDAIFIRFRDDGPGVPEEELGRLFEPFYRPDRSRTRDTGGSGLGLAIVRTCLEACGGRVSATQPSGGGFEVSVQLVADNGKAG